MGGCVACPKLKTPQSITWIFPAIKQFDAEASYGCLSSMQCLRECSPSVWQLHDCETTAWLFMRDSHSLSCLTQPFTSFDKLRLEPIGRPSLALDRARRHAVRQVSAQAGGVLTNTQSDKHSRPHILTSLCSKAIKHKSRQQSSTACHMHC